MSECSKGTYCCRADDRLLQIDTIVNEADVAGWVTSQRSLSSQEFKNLALNVGVLTVLDVFRENAQSMFSLAWADFHDSIDDRFAEGHVRVIL